VLDFASRYFIPVALLSSELGSQNATGEFLRSLNRQMFINQGVYVATADGKALATIMPNRIADGKPLDQQQLNAESQALGISATWTPQVMAALKRGLKEFGDVEPRENPKGDPLPSDGVGFHPDGSASLVCYARPMHRTSPTNEQAVSLGGETLEPGGLGAIESITLTAEEMAALAPLKTVADPPADAPWTLPHEVARKFHSVLSFSCNVSLPRPDELSEVGFTAKVDRVDGTVAHLTYEGRIAGQHDQGNGVVWDAEARIVHGTGTYDMQTQRLQSVVLIFEARRTSTYNPAALPQPFAAVLEWRHSRP